MERGSRHARRFGLELGEGFFLERDDGDVVACRTRGVEHQKRESAVARNQTEAHRLSLPYSSAISSSARRVARRRMTPRVELRMKSTIAWTSSQARFLSRSICR